MYVPQTIRQIRRSLRRGLDFRAARESLLTSPDLGPEGKRWLDRVSLKVHSDDQMYAASAAREYLAIGLSALRCVDNALKISRAKAVGTILDLPCGYGRILRFLKAAFPEARVVACDINAMAVSFCKRAFSVEAVLSNETFTLSLPTKFDLIWCGSLFTHIDEPRTRDLLRFFYANLAPGGLCLVTTHGQKSAQWLRTGEPPWASAYRGLSVSGQQKVLRDFAESGYGYADYESQVGLGISIVSRSRMEAIARSVGAWTESVFFERGWAGHHDVYGFLKPDVS
jgi:SAM-dependent methyltransferase